MGLLDKLFNKKSEEPQKIELPEDWDIYLCDIDGKVGSYLLNLALIQVAPVSDKNCVLWLDIKLNQPNEDGMPTQNEYDRLLEIEDLIIPQIEKDLKAIYVARLTHDGSRELYFYLNENHYSQSNVQKIVQQIADYQFDFGSKLDPEWNSYRQSFYPNVYAMQSIQNSRVIRNLEKHGDILTVKRPVEHWCYFKTSAARDHFLQVVQEKGYEIIDQSNDEENENPYSVQIGRIDNVDLPNINQVTWELLELCIENDGEYDGWETPVIRN